MKTHKHLFEKLCSWRNIILAWRKARKGKTKRPYVIEFESDLRNNLFLIKQDLERLTYYPKSLKRFVIKDPKTRVIHSSHFRDRIVHHSIVNILEPIFEKIFIYDSCANRMGKGNLFALKRFEEFKRKVTKNLTREAYCIKADIKHYFQEVSHHVLLKILRIKIQDEKIIGLIKRILNNGVFKRGSQKGMPLGNLTSQFFANVYLSELDSFVKHSLRAKYYIRYVDDFVILHESKEQLEIWMQEIDKFLREKLKIELHPQKSKIMPLSRGIDFVGFRNFWHYRLLRKRNIQNMKINIEMFKQGLMAKEKFLEIFQGWNAYACWANTFKLRLKILNSINKKAQEFTSSTPPQSPSTY